MARQPGDRPRQRSPLSGAFRIALLRPVGAGDLHVAIVAGTVDAHAPRIAADLAVLHESTRHVGLEIDFDLLTAVRTRDEELIVHEGPYATVTLYSS
jgi:hypothetical protein